MKQLSLLGEAPLPPGLQLFPDFISVAEEQSLLAAMKGLTWEEVRMHGVVAKRRVKHYGLSYGYESWSIKETESARDFLRPLMERAAPHLHTSSELIAELLVTEYPSGAGIGWHRDAPMFGDAIFGISLGSACTMKFRKKVREGFEVLKAELEPRAAYVISGPARREWQHHIAPVKTPRWSITFRTLKEQT